MIRDPGHDIPFEPARIAPVTLRNFPSSDSTLSLRKARAILARC